MLDSVKKMLKLFEVPLYFSSSSSFLFFPEFQAVFKQYRFYFIFFPPVFLDFLFFSWKRNVPRFQDWSWQIFLEPGPETPSWKSMENERELDRQLILMGNFLIYKWTGDAMSSKWRRGTTRPVPNRLVRRAEGTKRKNEAETMKRATTTDEKNENKRSGRRRKRKKERIHHVESEWRD